MEILIDRAWKKEGYTISRLSINGVRICEALEDRDRGLKQTMPLADIKAKKVYGETAIPSGRYMIDMNTVSPKFQNKVWAAPYKGKLPRLLGVPGWDGVLIHPGTDANSTLGCIIVGKNTVKGKVTSSQDTFHKIMKQYLVPASSRGEKIFITIE